MRGLSQINSNADPGTVSDKPRSNEDITVESIKKALIAIAGVCQEIGPYLESGESICRDVADIASSLTQAEKYTKDLGESIAVLSDLSFLLSSLPVVGTAISGIGKALGEAQKPVDDFHKVFEETKPIIETVDKSSKMLADECASFKKAMSFADSNFRNYANSLDILKSCMDLLIVISESISDEKTKSDFDALICDIESTIIAASNAITDAKNAVKETQDLISAVNEEFKKAAKPVMTVSDAFNKGCKAVSSIFSPITQIFNKILSAVKPIKWLLKAFSKIFENVIKPIVDKILSPIGFKALMKKISDEISEKLEINKLSKQITGFKDKLSEETTKKITEKINAVVEQINRQYDQLDKLVSLNIFEEKVITFLQNSYDSFMNQELPDFPIMQMAIGFPYHTDSVGLYSRPYVPTEIEFPLHDDAGTYIIPADPLLTEECNESVKNGINCVNAFVGQVNDLYARWTKIQNGMLLCDKYTQDIVMYEQLCDELTDWIGCFEDIVFFEKLNNLLEDLKERVNKEKNAVEILKNAMEQCRDKYSETYLQFQKAYRQIPNQKCIDDLYTSVMNIEDSYNSTKETIDSCDGDKQTMSEILRKRYNEYIAEIKDFPQKLETAKQTVVDCIAYADEIEKHVDALSQKENMIIAPETYQALSSLNQHLAGLHSAILPIKQILKFVADKQNDGDDKVKDFFVKLGDVLGKASKYVDYVIQMPIFDDFIAKAFPFGEITDKVNETMKILQDVNFAAIGNVQSDIDRFKTDYLRPILQYVDDCSGDNVYDYFMDQELKDMIQKGAVA